jgi:hypothetical protein
MTIGAVRVALRTRLDTYAAESGTGRRDARPVPDHPALRPCYGRAMAIAAYGVVGVGGVVNRAFGR